MKDSKQKSVKSKLTTGLDFAISFDFSLLHFKICWSFKQWSSVSTSKKINLLFSKLAQKIKFLNRTGRDFLFFPPLLLIETVMYQLSSWKMLKHHTVLSTLLSSLLCRRGKKITSTFLKNIGIIEWWITKTKSSFELLVIYKGCNNAVSSLNRCWLMRSDSS